jgi:hypothetical protein
MASSFVAVATAPGCFDDPLQGVCSGGICMSNGNASYCDCATGSLDGHNDADLIWSLTNDCPLDRSVLTTLYSICLAVNGAMFLYVTITFARRLWALSARSRASAERDGGRRPGRLGTSTPSSPLSLRGWPNRLFVYMIVNVAATCVYAALRLNGYAGIGHTIEGTILFIIMENAFSLSTCSTPWGSMPPGAGSSEPVLCACVVRVQCATIRSINF